MKQHRRKDIGILDELFRTGINAHLRRTMIHITLPKVNLFFVSYELGISWYNIAKFGKIRLFFSNLAEYLIEI